MQKSPPVSTRRNRADVDSIEHSIVRIVREAGSARLQAAISAEAGVILERAGYALLREIEEHGPIPISALARVMGLDGSTVSRQVASLERSSLVRRRSSANDGRIAEVALTDDGERALANVGRARHKFFESVLDGWDRNDRHALAPLLARLATDLTTRGDHRS